MSQQPLDFQRSFRIVRRHLKLFWTFIVLGLLIGVGYAVLAPPTLSSTALVVLPQVASQGHQHLRVAKSTDGRTTRTSLTHLTPVDRVEEIARMLSGANLTEASRKHAEQMLAASR